MIIKNPICPKCLIEMIGNSGFDGSLGSAFAPIALAPIEYKCFNCDYTEIKEQAE